MPFVTMQPADFRVQVKKYHAVITRLSKGLLHFVRKLLPESRVYSVLNQVPITRDNLYGLLVASNGVIER